MNLNDVMDQLGAAVDTITGLRVQAYGADRVTPPAAMVELPERWELHQAYQDGAAAADMTITVVVGRLDARTTRGRLAGYVTPAGPTSVKAAIESYEYTACDSVTVTAVEFGTVAIGGTEYLAARFECAVFGNGE